MRLLRLTRAPRGRRDVRPPRRPEREKPTATEYEAYPDQRARGGFLVRVYLSPETAELRREPLGAAPWAPLAWVNARPNPTLASTDRSPTRVEGGMHSGESALVVSGSFRPRAGPM